MMYSNAGFSVGFAFHWVFMILTLLGLVAGVVWMARFASKKQLKLWFILGLVLGLLGCLLTFGAAIEGMQGMMGDWIDSDDESDLDSSDLNDRIDSMEEWRDEMMGNEEEDVDSSTEETPAL